jgi:methionine-gamma-lyase
MKTVINKTKNLLGANSNAFEAFLLTNGLRTFSLRMERHCTNGEQVATFLEAHPAVETVYYLGLASHPDHTTAMKQMKHAGAMMSFELKGGLEAGKRFINSLQLLTHAVSLGTCDTLLSHPASTTHAGVPREKRLEFGVSDGLIRMSVGLENVEDIIADLTQALANA